MVGAVLAVLCAQPSIMPSVTIISKLRLMFTTPIHNLNPSTIQCCRVRFVGERICSGWKREAVPATYGDSRALPSMPLDYGQGLVRKRKWLGGFCGKSAQAILFPGT